MAGSPNLLRTRRELKAIAALAAMLLGLALSLEQALAAGELKTAQQPQVRGIVRAVDQASISTALATRVSAVNVRES